MISLVLKASSMFIEIVATRQKTGSVLKEVKSVCINYIGPVRALSNALDDAEQRYSGDWVVDVRRITEREYKEEKLKSAAK